MLQVIEPGAQRRAGRLPRYRQAGVKTPSGWLRFTVQKGRTSMRGLISAVGVMWSVAAGAAAIVAMVSLSAQSPRPAASPSAPAAASRSTAIVPFKIRVSDAELADLKQRLTRARFADEIPGAGVGLRHQPRLPEDPGRLLARQVRLAGAGTAAEPVRAVQDQHRRARHPLHPSALEGRRGRRRCCC